MAVPNATHDPSLQSWVSAANRAAAEFPIQNLPYAVFRRAGTAEAWRGGVAIGDQVLDLAALHELGTLTGVAGRALSACTGSTLNDFLALGAPSWSALRAGLSCLLRAGAPEEQTVSRTLVPQADVEYSLPVHIGGFTDFYASIHHATAVGKLFRPDNPLLPNYKWVPIAYHGRTSSIGVSGQEIPRPMGQILPTGAAQPLFTACRRLDYELEVGIFVGTGNARGAPVTLAAAEEHIFGLCLLNDWSARDIQAWEYQPLGPFLAKNFATTISPWIVTLEALAPYRVPWTRPAEDPQPLSYLDGEQLRVDGGLDLYLEAAIETARMRATGLPPYRLSTSNFRHCYWSIAQMLAHHTVNGCNLESGDLLGSGTQSGPNPEEAGSLLELSAGGSRPISLPSGETRTFLADGDRVIFRGWCAAPGRPRIGFGEVSGTITPARNERTPQNAL